MKLRTQLAILMLIAFASTGCIFSPGGDDDPPPPPPPINTCADSPDGVMQLFRTIYAARNLDAYREILSRAYLWIPQGDEAIWNYDEEIAATEKMFNGLAGNNDIIISSISVDQLEPQGTWQPTPTNDPNFGGFPGSQYRNYLVDFSFSISGQNLIFRVQGPVLYYVMSETEGDQTCFKILGMVDATFGN